jgi:hypothetical protein
MSGGSLYHVIRGNVVQCKPLHGSFLTFKSLR